METKGVKSISFAPYSEDGGASQAFAVMGYKTAPRFKVGDLIEYSPALTRKPKKRPVWRVEDVQKEEQVYILSRATGAKLMRVLFFNRQRRYRVHGLPYEEQPPMWPKPDEQ